MTIQVLRPCSKLWRNYSFNHGKKIFWRDLSSSGKSYVEFRVRFAPSPTGFLHLGGLRTALYNYLFVKAKRGKFILRIEDTDQARIVPEAAEKMEAILNWVGITPDESPAVGGMYGPYFQSQRSDLYQKYIQRLLDNGTAYKCFCTSMRLNLLRKDLQRRGETIKYDNRCRTLSKNKIDKFEEERIPFCIRLKLENITEPFHDILYGSILNNIADQEGDPILMKSDGFPTYHFANVVDDHLMGVTHVLRGVEWQVSTPKHLLLYKAFGWEPPLFGHLPLIKNSDGTKLSKRQGDLHIESLKAQGFSAISILNFAINIGGGFEEKDHNQIYDIEQLIQKFNLERINTNSCKLEIERLSMFNQLDLQQRLQQPSERAQMVEQLRQMLQQKYSTTLCLGGSEGVLTAAYLTQILLWSKDRIFRLSDLLKPEFTYIWIVPQDLMLDQLPSISSISHVELLKAVIETLSCIAENDFTKEHVTQCVKNIGKQYGVKISLLMSVIRRTISGLKQGPPVGEMLSILGKETSLARLSHALSLL